jgi:hypothetical protein
MAWPPTTHQDVQDELGIVRLGQRDYFRSGYYSLGTFIAGSAGSAITGGSAYARPFIIGAQRAFDRIGISVTTAATAGSGGLIQCGLYAPGLGMPGALTLTTATVSSETTGAKEWTIAVTLDPGIWWVATRAVVAGCSVQSIQGEVNPYVSQLTAPAGVASGAGFSASVTAATPGLPAAFTSGAGTVPLAMLRAA